MLTTIDFSLIIGGSIALILAAFYSALDIAFSELNKNRIEELEVLQTKRSKRLIQIIDTIESTTLSIQVAKTILICTSVILNFLFFYHIFGESGWLLLVLIAFVSILLLISLMTPSVFARVNPLGVALRLVSLVSIARFICAPVVLLLSTWKHLLRWVFKLGPESVVTERELLYYLDEAEKDGGIEEHEKDLIQSAIEFEDIRVEDILTPRVDLIAISFDHKTERIEEKFETSGFSRLPVYKQEIDDIVGFIHEKDFYRALRLGHADQGFVAEIVKDVIYVTPSMSVASVLAQLQLKKTHIAVVIDEYGGTMGIVTLEDIIEELVGEIWDEHDKVIEYVVPLNDHSYRINCELGLQKFFDEFDLKHDYDDYDATLVNGWVIQMMGKFPQPKEQFMFENLLITVLHVADKKVIDIQVDVVNQEEDTL